MQELSVYFLITIQGDLYIITDELVVSDFIKIHGTEERVRKIGYLNYQGHERNKLEREVYRRIINNDRNCFKIVNPRKDFLKPIIYSIL